jgi:polyisoprenoid-binding protein YceI
MKIFRLLVFVAVIYISTANAQKFITEKSEVTFFSSATLEDIKATNKKASGLFNAETNEIVFSIPINEFKFKKSLMQQHFNEKYMETEKFPKSTFQGTVSGFKKETKGSQQVKAIGKLTIHGVTKDVQINGTIDSSDPKLMMKAVFNVKLEEYNITRPQLLWQNIAEQVAVTTLFTFKPQ